MVLPCFSVLGMAASRSLSAAFSTSGTGSIARIQSGFASEAKIGAKRGRGWADPDGDEDGWETLTVDSSTYRKYVVGDSRNQNQGSINSSQNSSSGSGSVGVGGFGGSGHNEESDAPHQTSGSGNTAALTSETATGLKISAWWGVCTVKRPWLLSDLFHMNGWNAVNNRINGISDCTIENQVQNATPLMPMIPIQFVVSGISPSRLRVGKRFGSIRGLFQPRTGLSTIGWLCDIVPACPKLADPAYKPPKKKPA